MANKFPYVPSAGPLVKTVTQLRKSFPKEVTAETLRKLGVAPKNETYVINVLRFLGVIDEEGKQVSAKTKAFLQGDDAFRKDFSGLVKDAYEELFELQGEDAWRIDRSGLVQFFRTTDQSSEIVGTRQASTFQALAGLAGYSEMPAVSPKKPVTKKATTAPGRTKAAKSEPTVKDAKPTGGTTSDSRFGLTVRVEVNLPADGDEATYDAIFRSIRKNFINAE